MVVVVLVLTETAPKVASQVLVVLAKPQALLVVR
jgi:hypothetical protein